MFAYNTPVVYKSNLNLIKIMQHFSNNFLNVNVRS